MDVRIGMSPTIRVRLQRGTLVGAADWYRLRDLGNHLFGEPRPPAHRSLQAQDKFALTLKQRGQEKRAVLQGLHQRLIHLCADGGDRLEELAEANSRLAPLAQTTTDSQQVLNELLAAWPDDAADTLRALVQGAEAIRDALGELNENARKNLQAGANHSVAGSEVQDHLQALKGRLEAAQAEQPLTKDWIKDWNKTAQQLIQRLIEQPAPTPPQPSSGQPPGLVAPSVPTATLCDRRLSPTDPDAVSDFLAEIRRTLSELSDANIRVALVRLDDSE